MQEMIFCVWLFSFCMMLLRFSHVAMCINSLYPFTPEPIFHCIWMYHNLLIYSRWWTFRLWPIWSIYKSVRNGSSSTLLWECKMVQLLWESAWHFLKRISTWLSESIPSIYPKELETGIQTNSFMPMFLTALFTIAESSTNPSIHQWTNREIIVCPYTTVSFSYKKGMK